MVQSAKIYDLFNLTKYIKTFCFGIDKPHLDYKMEWFCYGDLLFNKIYTYEESINIIKSLNLNDITTPKEWLDYYNNIIEYALNNECDENELILLNKIMFIPYDPKTYYLKEWNKVEDNNELNIGWNKFLDKSLENTTGLEITTITSSCSTNASNNLQNIINQDQNKVKHLIKDNWQTFTILKSDLNDLKNYIDTNFNIDCNIEYRFRLTNTYSVHSQILNIRTNKSTTNFKPPITISFNYNCTYDKNIYNNNITSNINRTEEFLIQHEDIQNIIDNIKNELKQYIEDYKKNNIL